MNKVTAVALACSAAAALGVPAAASAATHHFEGRVVSVDRSARTFRLDDSERGVKSIRVVASTDFERVTFAKLHKGVRGIEVTARRSGGRWVAVSVEKSGGGGDHGGSDDTTTDDHGGHGHGSDD